MWDQIPSLGMGLGMGQPVPEALGKSAANPELLGDGNGLGNEVLVMKFNFKNSLKIQSGGTGSSF